MASLDPHTNILRATAAVFGASLGGADSITVLPFSQRQGLPNGFARRVARNVQNVLGAESNLWRVNDPASAPATSKPIRRVCAKRPGPSSRTRSGATGRDPILRAGTSAGDRHRGLSSADGVSSRSGGAGMSRIPDFRDIRFASETVASRPGHDWLTPEGLTVKTCYWPEDMKGIDFLHTWPAPRPSCAAPTQPCTPSSHGPSGNTQASPPRRTPMPSTGGTLPPGRWACRSPSTSRHIADMTRIIRAWQAMSAWQAWRSTRSMTCGRSSTVFRSTR